MNLTEKEPKKPVPIDAGLHSALKALASRQGLKLGAMCEDKLRELIPAGDILLFPLASATTNEESK